MDLPCLEWQKHVEKKWDGLSAALKTCFSSLLEVDDIVAFAQSQTDRKDVTMLSEISKRYQVQKDPGIASSLREEGNACFRARDYSSAIMYYSQAVCCASPGSEELALCYANRSAALFHLHLYQECLDDIGRALNHGYPAHLHQKLLDRREQCLKRQRGAAMQQGDSGGCKDRGLNTTSGRDGLGSIPHVSSAVALCFSPEKGRHLVARDGVAAGEVLLEERAFACVLIPGASIRTRVNDNKVEEEHEKTFGTEHLLCHHCLGETRKPVPCPGCRYTRYCGEECQQAAWKGHHCWECTIGGELHSAGVLAHLALRVAFRAGLKEIQRVRGLAGGSLEPPSVTSIIQDKSTHSCRDPPQQQMDGSYLGVHCLLTHVSRHSPPMRFLCAVTVVTLCRKLKEVGALREYVNDEDGGTWCPGLSLLGAAVLRHMFQLRCNSQAVTVQRDCGTGHSSVSSVWEVRVATAIFPALSMLNHSCRPNTSITFKTGASMAPGVGPRPGGGDSGPGPAPVTVTVRTTQDVGEGRELLHCYGPHYSRMPVSERQRLLLEQYFFLCQCDTCCGGQGEAAALGLRCTQCGTTLQCAEQGYLCPRSHCGFLLSHGELSHRLQQLHGLLEQAVCLIERDRPDEAAQELQVAISDADRFLEQTHPLRGQLADAAARALAAVGNWQEAATQLSHSLGAIQTRYGDDSAELGRQLFKLVQLHFNGRQPQKALSLIPKARHLLSLHFDPFCEELQELRAMEDCLQGAL